MQRSIVAAAGLAIPQLQFAIAYAQAGAGMLEQAHEGLTAYVAQGADGGVIGLARGLWLLARTELGMDRLESREEAARILGAADRARADLGRVRWPAQQAQLERFERELREHLGEKPYSNARERGRAMAPDEAIAWLRRARGARKRPAGGWESLTPTELIGSAAALAAAHTIRNGVRTTTRTTLVTTACSAT
jgi:hypothetical protein